MSQSPYMYTYICTIYFETFSSCRSPLCKFSKHKFTLNLSQRVFIDSIYRINRTETWNFNAPTLVTSVSFKITAKFGILCPKTLLLTEKQLHAIHFFVATRNVCPLAIPESCAQNMGLRLLENHSLHLGSHTCWLSYFTLVCLWCGQTVARSVYGHVITKFSRMSSLPHFLSYGAPPTRGASSAIKNLKI